MIPVDLLTENTLFVVGTYLSLHQWDAVKTLHPDAQVLLDYMKEHSLIPERFSPSGGGITYPSDNTLVRARMWEIYLSNSPQDRTRIESLCHWRVALLLGCLEPHLPPLPTV